MGIINSVNKTRLPENGEFFFAERVLSSRKDGSEDTALTRLARGEIFGSIGGKRGFYFGLCSKTMIR